MIQVNNVDDNKGYYQIGKSADPTQWVISYSNLNKLDPALGGHPSLFYKSMIEDSGITNKSMENGNLLHDWIERKDQFIISEETKPSEKLALMAEAFSNLYIKEGYKTNSSFSSYCSGDYGIELSILEKYRDMFREINFRNPTNDELKLFIYAFRYSREVIVMYNKTLKEDTVLSQFLPLGLPYIKFLKKADGKIMLTANDRDTLVNCHESVKRHPLGNNLFFELEGQHEVELFWEEEIDGIVIKRKAKLDKVIVDYETKTLIIPDLKTTGYPVALFATGENCSYKKYAYGGQLVSYADGWFKTNKIDGFTWKVQLVNIVVQSNNEYPVMGYETNKISSEIIRIISLLKRLVFHIKSNNWNLTKEEIEDGVIRIN